MKSALTRAIRRAFFTVLLGTPLFLLPCQTARAVEFFESTVFTSGQEGYAYYRIPSIVQAADGTLLAFAEGRKNDRDDSGDIDLVLRRSFDNGVSWDSMQVIWSNGQGVAGNPCPVVDQTTGKILLVSNHQTEGSTQTTIRNGTFGERTYHVQQSTDHGATWSNPTQITATDVLNPLWMAGGPNHGIQLVRGAEAGRLIIAGNHSVGVGAGYDLNRGHVIYSDDGGTTWELGAVSSYNSEVYVSETAAVERLDGSIYFSTRDQNGPSVGNRAYTISNDAGETFAAAFQIDSTAIAPVCQGSIVRYSSTDLGDSTNRIIQSYPFSGTARENLLVRSSFNEASTWNSGRVIYEGSSAYSDLVRTADNRIGVIYERDSYSTITFASFTTAWLDDDQTLKLHSTMNNTNPTTGLVFDDYNGHNGQLAGNAAPVNDATRGTVLDVAGYGNYVTYGDVLDPMNVSYTASFWFKISDTGQSQILASKGMNDSSADTGWAAVYSAVDGQVYFRANHDGVKNNQLSIGKVFGIEEFGEWHHMAVVFDQENGLIRAYLDGLGSGLTGTENGWLPHPWYQGIAFTPGTVFEATSKGGVYDELTVGFGKSTGYMDGFIDDFAVWTRALTDAEILGLYQGDAIPTDLIPGDANRDYIVDAADAKIVAQNWGALNSLMGAAAGDFNHDGKVDATDVSILAANWGNHNEGSTEGSDATATPEPSTLLSIVFGVLMLAIGRRRVSPSPR
ncbi:MAG: PEP-CTERM sorting domain-containing protein [Pirellulaceae bacterium]|nr:PEP-CTERM sorting domain-containing protein [Pirellulaceae bacterium]